MAFPLPTSYAATTPFLIPHPSSLFSHIPPRYSHRNSKLSLISHRKPLLRPQLNSKAAASSTNLNPISEDNTNNISKEIEEYVEVFGIGSRKDAVLDFCLNSPSLSPALRFWNILVKDSAKLQLQQRLPNKDTTPSDVKAPSEWRHCSKAVILVASAAYGSDDTAALDILKTIKSENGFVIGIILKPFSFEGQRRQDEVNHLVDKLQEHANFFIVVDTDALLEKDLLTLDEALKTSNDAVLTATNSISILVSEKHIKHLEVEHNDIKEIKLPELQKILEAYKEAKIGFAAGFNIKTSVLRAVYDCPFLGFGVKDSSGTIICILESSGVISENDAGATLRIVRRTTEYKGEIIVSIVHEPRLEPNLIRTTIIAFGCTAHQSNKKIGIFSRLAQHFPFIFSILNNQSPEPDSTKERYASKSQHLSGLMFEQEQDQMLDRTSLDDTSEALGVYTHDVEPLFNNSDEDISSSRGYDSTSEQVGIELSDPDPFPFTYVPNAKGAPTFKEELLTRYRLGPDNQNTQEWTKELDADTDASLSLDNVSTYKLPVGVKHLEQADNSPTYIKQQKKWIREDSKKVLSDTSPNLSWDVMGDRGFEATVSFNNLSKFRNGSYALDSNKQGGLSNRAASMLEAERDSPNKKWSPILEMKYRGGTYRGRIQGGLPEGKGRLSLGDGSIYDGMWRYGKRSGLGTFYFKNGDVFQGSWRDDVMHGKGWFYFHTGDRWFANFWKGKANGEGRFYSKLGDVFFGHFKDGWRHGHLLCIGLDGTRYHEVWEEGVLVSSDQLESDA